MQYYHVFCVIIMHSALLIMVQNTIFLKKQHFEIFLSTLIWTLHELGIFHDFCSNTVIRTYTTIRQPRVISCMVAVATAVS